jgi:hypothetical protein
MKLYIHISYHRIINAKWLEYLNTKPETLKLLDKSKEEILTLVWTMIFFGYNLEKRSTKAKIDKWDCMQLKCLWTAKETIDNMKKLPTD